MREHLPDTELAKPDLGRLVPGRHQPDDSHPGEGEPGQGIPVEPAQIGGEHDRSRQSRGGRGEQVGQVHAAANHGDAVLAAVQRGDQVGLPASVRDRGQDGYAGHRPAVPSVAGDATRPVGAMGTRARSMVPASAAWTTERTSPVGTEITTDSVAVPEKLRAPES